MWPTILQTGELSHHEQPLKPGWKCQSLSSEDRIEYCYIWQLKMSCCKCQNSLYHFFITMIFQFSDEHCVIIGTAAMRWDKVKMWQLCYKMTGDTCQMFTWYVTWHFMEDKWQPDGAADKQIIRQQLTPSQIDHYLITQYSGISYNEWHVISWCQSGRCQIENQTYNSDRANTVDQSVVVMAQWTHYYIMYHPIK